MNNNKNLPLNVEVEKFKMLSPMLDDIFLEIKELSKKKQNEPLNELKVKMINQILTQLNEILSNEPTIQYVDLLDEETLPSNSDAVLIISKYRTALQQFKSKYSHGYGSSKSWYTKENPTGVY